MKHLSKEELKVRLQVTSEQYELLLGGLIEAQALPDQDVFIKAHIAAIKRDLVKLNAERIKLLDTITELPTREIEPAPRLRA
jgi:hypothetical protein